MYTDLRKTLTDMERCLPTTGEPSDKQLRRLYELTQKLFSQELAVIYDKETFGATHQQEQPTLAQQQSQGSNENGVVTLTIHEVLPPVKRLTEAVEEHWKAMLHAAIEKAEQQGPLPFFDKAMVEIEIVTPRGLDNSRVWDTSNRAIQLILNNLKGIFFHDDDREHMAFSIAASWGEKSITILRISRFSTTGNHQLLDEKTASP